MVNGSNPTIYNNIINLPTLPEGVTASEATAKFSGNWNDLSNVPTLPEGISGDTILSNDAANTRASAEARHAAGLAQVNADGGFFDAYVDQSKISSLTNINLNSSSGGSIKLSVSGTGNVVSRKADGNTISLSDKVGLSIKPVKDIRGVKGSLSANTSGATNAYLIRLSDGNTIATDNISSGTFVLESDLTKDELYYVLVDDGGNSYTAGFATNNFSDSDHSTTEVNGTDIDIQGGSYPGTSATNDGFGINDLESLELSKAGTATHSQFTFTDTTGTAFVPSKIGIYPEYDASGTNESVTIDLLNSSGNTVKTFQESDFGQLQSVSVSDDTFHLEVNESGDGSSTPKVDYVDVRGV